MSPRQATLLTTTSRRSFLQGLGVVGLATGTLGMPRLAWGAEKTSVNVAIIGEPDTLDPMVSTKDVVSIVTQHFLETLFTFDGSWKIAPLLAADLPKISDDGKTYVIAIREGVPFHDGSIMTADDVVASLGRWLKVASRGQLVADKVASVEKTGDHEVTLKLKSSYSPLLSLLAFSNSAAVIYPKSTLAATMKQPIGTGPYKIKEHVLDQYLQLEKFDKYASRSEPSNGAAGKREQTMEQIRFVPVADPNTRVEGTMSGQFDFADSLPTESYGRLAKSATATPVVYESFGWPVYAINHKAGLMTTKKIRQAVEAALPIDDMLFAAFGDEKFYQVDGAMYPKGWVWHNDAGLKLFNQNNKKKAAKLLKEAGYKGEPLRILTSHQYEFHFKMTQVAKMALEAAGFKVHMDVVDWATLGQRRNNPALWDIYVTHSPFLPEPALTDMWSKTSRLGWANPAKDKTFEEFTTVTELAKRQAAFAKLQGDLYEDVGFLKIGAFSALWGQAKGLSGVPKTPWPFFWNAKLSA